MYRVLYCTGTTGKKDTDRYRVQYRTVHCTVPVKRHRGEPVLYPTGSPRCLFTGTVQYNGTRPSTVRDRSNHLGRSQLSDGQRMGGHTPSVMGLPRRADSPVGKTERSVYRAIDGNERKT